jgi:Cohesin domain/Purple acid Phosphatase, N-terminal domain
VNVTFTSTSRHRGLTALTTLAALLIMPAFAAAQSPSLTVGTASGLPGQGVDVPIGLTPGAAAISSIQFDVVLPSSLSWVSTAPGSAASSAGKDVSSAALPGVVRVIIFGLNQNSIGTGTVAVVRLMIAPGTPAGPLTVGMTGMAGSAPDGSAVSVTGTSGSVTVNASGGGTTPPMISGVSAMNVSDTAATITWTTGDAADTQVEYGLTAAYGKSTTLISTMSTSHSQTLADLTPQTLYHYRVKSKNPAGNLAVSGDYTFTTADSEPVTDPSVSLYLPTFSLDRSALGIAGFRGSGFTGLALANLDTFTASLMFTAFNPDGKLTSGAGVTNPARRNLTSGGQLPIVDTQIFGTSAGPVGWMKVDSTASKISSFFMAFDSNLTVLDGANAARGPVKTAILPEVGESGFNRIYLANPATEPIVVTLSLTKSDGTERAGTTRQIDTRGVLAADLYTDVFPEAPADPSDYLRITTSGGIVPYGLLAQTGKDIRILNGQDAARGAARLYSPQYVVGGPWSSTISVVNLDSRVAAVTLHFVPDDLSKAEKSVSFQVPANGKVYVSDQRIFLDPGADLTKTVTQGWVEISSDGARLAGSVTFGSAGSQNFASALPLVDEVNRDVIFSHAASNATWFTGIALLNPGSFSTQATIDLYGANGNREATVTTDVPARGRKSRLLTELFPMLTGTDRTSGYIRVSSTWPLASFALFGTNSLSVLSAIPAQAAP